MLTSYIYKQPKLTRFIAYKYKPHKTSPIFHYRLCDTQSGKYVGFMKAGPQVIDDDYFHFSPNVTKYWSFFIDRLRINPEIRRQGAGSALINIAKHESIRNLCCGNVHLISKNTQTPSDAPHLFYIKNGFKCNKYNSIAQEYLDEWAATGQQPEPKHSWNKLHMFIEKCTINQEKIINAYYRLKVLYPSIFNRL